MTTTDTAPVYHDTPIDFIVNEIFPLVGDTEITYGVDPAVLFDTLRRDNYITHEKVGWHWSLVAVVDMHYGFPRLHATLDALTPDVVG